MQNRIEAEIYSCRRGDGEVAISELASVEIPRQWDSEGMSMMLRWDGRDGMSSSQIPDAPI